MKAAPLIDAKLRPPVLPAGLVRRPRLLDAFGSPARVVLVAAPPGYGKTVAVRQWAEGADLPVAWLSLDRLDDNPATFWSHLIAAVRRVLPDVDGEAAEALGDDVRSDLFLAVLVGQIERSTHRAALVLENLALLADRDLLDGLALLVERVGDRLQLVITTRAGPMLPIPRWRAAGWVSDLREEHLRLDDDEALAVAATFEDLHLGAATVVALNRRVGGWPIAFTLALTSARESDDPEGGARALTRTDGHLAEFLVGEIIGGLDPADREIALALAVVERFDADLATGLAGPDAGRVVAELRRRRLLSDAVDGHPGAVAFHGLVRELLDRELRWRDPARHADLHRTAAELWRRRGDLNAAYRHLGAVGDVTASNRLIVQPALELVARGDRVALKEMIGSLPSTLRIDNPALALDLAIGCYFAGDRVRARRWCAAAAELAAPGDATVQLRLHAARCILALMDGALEVAAAHAGAFERLEPLTPVDGPMEQRFATVAARVALARRDLPAAARWIQRARAIRTPDAGLTEVTVPALAAWFDVESGHPERGARLVDAACEQAERSGLRPHDGASDALVTAAWAHLGLGDLARAEACADEARLDAELLGFDWNRVRAAAVAGEVRLLVDGPAAALAVLDDIRPMLDAGASALAAQLDVVEAKALQRAGRADAARRLLAADAGPGALLVRAAIAVDDGAADEVERLLDGAEGWPPDERLQAAVLRAAVGGAGPPVAAILEDAAAAGWVSPFLGHGPRVDAVLAAVPVEHLHPALAAHLRRPVVDRTGRPGPAEPLTAREVTILELLPTHLSYAEIGVRLFVSVNTVKSNLKSVYRKLQVANRSQAVEAGRAHGLL